MQNKVSQTDPSEVSEQLSIARSIAEDFAAAGLVGDAAPGYFILTLGCQQNEADSERLAGLCSLMGYRPVVTPEEARLILVNTCAIREHAEKRALSFIGEYKHIKESHPDTLIGVGGCMVTQRHRADKLKMSYPYVSFTFDTGAIHKVPSLVKKYISGKGRSFVISDEYRIAEDIPTVPASRHSAWLSVMYGCNNFCSYCIVPYVRGRERSRRPEDILAEARRLIDGGAREITLLGQNVNSYGQDLENGENFASVLRQVCALDGDFRVGFMTSHPKDASSELIDVMASEEKVLRRFHLPVQSGSNEILRRMNRRYTAEHYKSILDELKRKIPDVSITSDIIVGFPGETEEDFEATLDMLRYAEYDMIFSFIYSPRVGTPAAEMENKVPDDVASERFQRLIALQDSIGEERNRRFVGKRLRLLADEVSKTDSTMLTGRGDVARPVHFKGDPSLVGRFVTVEITKSTPYTLEGKLV